MKELKLCLLHCLTAQTTTHTHNRFMALLDFVQDYLGELVAERYNQEGKTNQDLLEQEIVSGSGISCTNHKDKHI